MDTFELPPRAPRPLGHLERAVLDHLFDREVDDVSGVHRTVGEPRGLSRNTIHSTLERLVRKALVERRARGRAYEYRAVASRREWIARSVGELLDAIPGADATSVLSSFVDWAARTGPEGLDELAALVRGRRRRLRPRRREDER